MDKSLNEKQDLTRFFNHIKSKYVIPKPVTKIPGKVTCRNGIEYIEKTYSDLSDPMQLSQISKHTRQKDYVGCGHNSCVTNPYRTLGEIVLDSKKLALQMFRVNNMLEKEQNIAMFSYNKWKNATKVVFPVIRLQGQGDKNDFDDGDKDSTTTSSTPLKRRRRSNFVVETKKWPKIQSTGYKQISDAVAMTNRRVSATKGTTPYFKVLETDNREHMTDGGLDSDIFEDTSLDPAPIDSIRRETVIKRLEAYIYVINSLFNIKNRDLKNRQPWRPDSVPQEDKQNVAQELPPIKGFFWNEGIPPWQKIKQENEFLTSGEDDLDVESVETDDQEFLLNLRKDFTSLQEKLDHHVHCRLKRVFRDEKQKFVRRFHALKHAPTLSLGVDELRRLDRTTQYVDNENQKTSAKQDWYNEALEDLDIKRYSGDEKICALVEQFERFSHTDIADEIKSLKAKLCYLTMSMPVYYVLQPDYQYTIKFVIRKCLAAQDDFFGSWFKMRFKKGNSNHFKS